MSNDRKNISIDGDVNDAIDPGVNYSRLVEEWTRQYFMEGNFYNVEKAMLETMIDGIEDSREQMHEQIDEMHDELVGELQAHVDHIETVGRDESQQTGSGEQWDEAMEKLSNTPRNPSNPAIKNWAKKLNTSPETLVEKLAEHYGDDTAEISATP